MRGTTRTAVVSRARRVGRRKDPGGEAGRCRGRPCGHQFHRGTDRLRAAHPHRGRHTRLLLGRSLAKVARRDALPDRRDTGRAGAGPGDPAPSGGLEHEWAGEEEVQEFDESEDEEQEDFGPVDFIKSFFRLPTVGFEFDVHYGPIPALPDARNGGVLSSHTHATDGFIVKLDGPRLEVNTRPFETSDDGKREIKETAARIKAFAEELASGCGNATTSSPAEFPGARPFSHPEVTVPIGKLAIGGKFTNCSSGRLHRPL